MVETQAIRIKRLVMRSMRRGIKEMDLILSSFANAHLEQMDGSALDLYEALLDESDHDIYGWVSGQYAAPADYTDLVSAIAAHYQPVPR